MPSLSSCNHFEILANICDSKTFSLDVQKTENIPDQASVLGPAPACIPVTTLRICKPKWEKMLPKAYTIASAGEDSNLLKLKIEIESADTTRKKLVTTLIDSGATGEFID